MAWNSEQVANANRIIQIGRSLGASDRDITIGLMTAMQESGLRNLNHGDRDSLGLFQQRPSMGWGSREQVTDPTYAITTFFKGKPGNPGLFSVKDRDSLSLTQAAQKVQRSGFPDAYAKHEQDALAFLGVGGTDAPAAEMASAPATGGARSLADKLLRRNRAPGSGEVEVGEIDAEALGADIPESIQSLDDVVDFMPQMSQADFMAAMGGERLPGDSGRPTINTGATGIRKSIVDEAMKYLGVDYVWGGTSPSGFDCSGIIQFVYGKMGIDLPRISYAQAQSGKQIGQAQAQPGDLWAIDNSSRNNGADHIAIYLGNGMILEAPRPGLAVRVRHLDDDEGGFFVDMQGRLDA